MREGMVQPQCKPDKIFCQSNREKKSKVEQSLTIRDVQLWAEMARPWYCQLVQSLAGCHPTNTIKTEAAPKEDTSWE